MKIHLHKARDGNTECGIRNADCGIRKKEAGSQKSESRRKDLYSDSWILDSEFFILAFGILGIFLREVLWIFARPG
jgi:hypothetical protein